MNVNGAREEAADSAAAEKEAAVRLEAFSEAEAKAKEDANAVKVADAEHYAMFQSMMKMMEGERAEMGQKHQETATLLQQALQDIVFLQRRNEELERSLVSAQAWESRY